MLSIFTHKNYLLKRQVFALTGKIRVYTSSGILTLYSEQKMFKLREDIRVFEDETKTREVLWIQARKIIDFAAAYDVTDQTMGQKVGALRRKGWRSMLRDAWEVLDPHDQVIGVIQEDSPMKAFLRRILLGSLLPQSYEVLIGDRVAAGRQTPRSAPGDDQQDGPVGVRLRPRHPNVEGASRSQPRSDPASFGEGGGVPRDRRPGTDESRRMG